MRDNTRALSATFYQQSSFEGERPRPYLVESLENSPVDGLHTGPACFSSSHNLLQPLLARFTTNSLSKTSLSEETGFVTQG